ncbi:MAG: YraN family protein [Mariprofundaceae bacterium]
MSVRRGRAAEARVARWLTRQGFSILDRNARLGRGEIDIVAREGDTLAFIEVKAHKVREASLLAVGTEKRERLLSAAQAWLGRHPDLAALQCRFDLIILTPRGRLSPDRIEHMKDIFRA